MKKLVISVISLLILLALVLLALLFKRQDAPKPELSAWRNHSMSVAVRASGWRQRGHRMDTSLAIGPWIDSRAIAVGGKAEILWQTVGGEDKQVIVADLSGKGGGESWYFARSRVSDKVFLLSGNTGLAFRLDVDTGDISKDFEVITRQVSVDRLSGGNAQLRWEGCLKNISGEKIEDPHLRAGLLLVDSAGVRRAYTGKPRHSTRRSGIPESFPKDAVFCTVLKGERLPRSQTDQPATRSSYFIEASWLTEGGIPHFATLHISPVAWRMEDASISGRAVVRGGEYPEAADKAKSHYLSDPSLVKPLRRNGVKLIVRTSEGIELSLERENVVVSYQSDHFDVDEKIISKVSELMGAFAKEDKTRLASMLGSAYAENTERTMMDDLQRRFGFDPGRQIDSPEITALDVIERGGISILHYFFKLSFEGGEVITGYDVIGLRKTANGWVFEIASNSAPIHP